jgi:erythromycin esterase
LEAILAVAANPFTASTYDTLPAARRAEIAASAHALVAGLDAHPGGPEWRIARQHARIAEQSLASPGRNDMEGALNARDRAMAENIRWLIDQEGKDAKAVLWAHNGHVARKAEARVEWMGSHLGKWLDANMVVFGFAFNRGSFQAVEMARGLRQFTVPAAPKGSLDAILAASGIGIGAVDLRKLPPGLVRQWFQAPRLTRSIGALFSDSRAFQLQPERVLDVYDGLLFVENTTAARANPGGSKPVTVIEKAPRNLDFEDSRALDGWRSLTARNSGFRIGITNEDAVSGKQAAFIQRNPGAWPGEFAGQLGQQVDASPFRGKRVRLSASVRTALQSDDGAAYLWLRAAQNSPLAPQSCSENMADQPIRTKGWARFAIECTVPKQADQVSFGLTMTGIGRVLMDSVSIEAY